MSVNSQVLSIVAQEQQFYANALSAEAVIASQTAFSLTQISIASVIAQPVGLILQEVTSIQAAVSGVIRSAADKEAEIAAKVNASFGADSSICWIYANFNQPVLKSAQETCGCSKTLK